MHDAASFGEIQKHEGQKVLVGLTEHKGDDPTTFASRIEPMARTDSGRPSTAFRSAWAPRTSAPILPFACATR